MSPNPKKKGRGGRKKGGTNQWGPSEKKVIEDDLREGKLTLAMIYDRRKRELNPMWQYRRSNYARFGDGTHYENDNNQSAFVRHVKDVAKSFVEDNAGPPAQVVASNNNQVSPMSQTSAATRHSTATVSVPYNVQSPDNWRYADPADSTSTRSRDTTNTRFTSASGAISRAPPSTPFMDELIADVGDVLDVHELDFDFEDVAKEHILQLRVDRKARIHTARLQEEAKFMDGQRKYDEYVQSLVEAELNQSEANLRAEEARKLAEENRKKELTGRHATREIVISQVQSNRKRYEERIATRVDLINESNKLKQVRFIKSCKKARKTPALVHGNNGNHQQIAQNLFQSDGSPDTQELGNVEAVPEEGHVGPAPPRFQAFKSMVAGLYPFGSTTETAEEVQVNENDENGSPVRVASLATGDVIRGPGSVRVVAAPGKEPFDDMEAAEEPKTDDDVSFRSSTRCKGQRSRPEPIDTISLADDAVDEAIMSPTDSMMAEEEDEPRKQSPVKRTLRSAKKIVKCLSPKQAGRAVSSAVRRLSPKGDGSSVRRSTRKTKSGWTPSEEQQAIRAAVKAQAAVKKAKTTK